MSKVLQLLLDGERLDTMQIAGILKNVRMKWSLNSSA